MLHAVLVHQNLQPVTMPEYQKLPEIDRTVVCMRAEEEMSYREIAQITGLSISAIKVKIFRSRAKLNKLLNKGD